MRQQINTPPHEKRQSGFVFDQTIDHSEFDRAAKEFDKEYFLLNQTIQMFRKNMDSFKQDISRLNEVIDKKTIE